MTSLLELIRTPVFVCVLSAIVGIGLGLGYDARRRLTGAVPIGAALAAGLLVGVLAPEASLATPALTLGFVLTILVRGARSRRLTGHADVDG